MTSYIVAVKRNKRAVAPDEWVSQVTHTAGVQVESVSDIGSKRALVRATPEGIRTVVEKYGSFLQVEESIEHSTN